MITDDYFESKINHWIRTVQHTLDTNIKKRQVQQGLQFVLDFLPYTTVSKDLLDDLCLATIHVLENICRGRQEELLKSYSNVSKANNGKNIAVEQVNTSLCRRIKVTQKKRSLQSRLIYGKPLYEISPDFPIIDQRTTVHPDFNPSQHMHLDFKVPEVSCPSEKNTSDSVSDFKRRRGRPFKRRNRVIGVSSAQSVSKKSFHNLVHSAIAKRKPGRPPGSLNRSFKNRNKDNIQHRSGKTKNVSSQLLSTLSKHEAEIQRIPSGSFTKFKGENSSIQHNSSIENSFNNFSSSLNTSEISRSGKTSQTVSPVTKVERMTSAGKLGRQRNSNSVTSSNHTNDVYRNSESFQPFVCLETLSLDISENNSSHFICKSDSLQTFKHSENDDTLNKPKRGRPKKSISTYLKSESFQPRVCLQPLPFVLSECNSPHLVSKSDCIQTCQRTTNDDLINKPKRGRPKKSISTHLNFESF